MKEYVESVKNADRLEEKAKELTQALGMSDVGEFGAEYIAREIIHTDTLDNYMVVPGVVSHYVVLDPLDERSGSGLSGGLSGGPISRLRNNGFIVKGIDIYEDVEDVYNLNTERSLPEKFAAVSVDYVGAEHPIIEYWDEE